MHAPAPPTAAHDGGDLAMAMDLGLFDALVQCHSAASLAHQLRLHPASTAQLLERLWRMGLLARTDGGHVPVYENTALAQRYLGAAAPTRCADSAAMTPLRARDQA